MSKYKVILVLGGPASGKGTLCKRLVTYPTFAHVSPGDLVRAKKERNDLDPEFAKLMAEGGLLPTSFIGKLIMNHIKTTIPLNKTILLDGFPRNEENYKYFSEEMNGFFDLVKVIVMNCSDGLMERRTFLRKEKEHRSDDEEKTFKRRLDFYHKETEKMIKLFDEKMIYNFHPDETSDDPYPGLIDRVCAINN